MGRLQFGLRKFRKRTRALLPNAEEDDVALLRSAANALKDCGWNSVPRRQEGEAASREGGIRATAFALRPRAIEDMVVSGQ